MQTSSSQTTDTCQAIFTADEHHCSQNWNPNTPKQQFSVDLDIEKLTPSQPGQDSSTSSPNPTQPSASMTGRASISMVPEKNLFGLQKSSMTSTTVSTPSVQEDLSQVSDKASECGTRSSHLPTIERSQSSPNFARPTVSSRQRTEKLHRPTLKPKEWTSSCTIPKSPKLRCVGKASEFESTTERDTRGNIASTKSLNSNKTFSCSRKPLIPSEPRTPNVLRRPSMYKRRGVLEEEPNRTFVPNPAPQYLKTGNLPEIKPTRKSQQHAEARKNPERPLRHDAPKKVKASTPWEPTSVKPFELGSVMKHEEYVYQIQRRTAIEHDDDKKRREFHPVTLRPEILEGPTFVPKRSDVPLTKPVDLLPHAKERSERTLAFEARQRTRMEEAARNQRIAAEEREKREEERLKREYESKRFKSKPVPQSHYAPDINPVWAASKAYSDSPASETRLPQIETQSDVDVVDNMKCEETMKTYEEVLHSTNDLASHTPTENKAVSILRGIRKSLSPLLGRGSTSLS